MTASAGRASRAARLARRVATLAFAAGAVAWLVLLRPTALGGSTTYVVVSGDSMLPAYQAGDLVVAKPADGYATGSVVVYRIPAGEPGAGRLVIHRIIAADSGTGYTTRGDHNSYTDIWRPTQADIVGTPAAVLPGFGTAVGFARTPLFAGLFAGLATFIWLWPHRRRVTVRDEDAIPAGDIAMHRPNPA